MPNQRGKKRNRILTHDEIQRIVDNDYMSSDNDEEERAIADELTSASSSESETEDSSSDDDQITTNQNANTQIINNRKVTNPRTNKQNVNVAKVGKRNANTPNINDGNRNITNSSDDEESEDDANDWHTARLRPRLLKFKGREAVNLHGFQPTTEFDYFRLLFDDEMVRKIISYTNAKAKQLIHNKPQNRRSPLHNFKNISTPEFFKFIGLTILMGNISMPSLKHYWSLKNKLYRHLIFGQTMPRVRFETILRALRFYDIEQNVTKKNKIQFVIDSCIQNFKKFYSPAKQLSIDEALLGFKGRLSYKQYIPLKRSRFGIKLYELCSSNGYVLDIILYTGKGTIAADKKKGHAYKVVQRLLKGYTGKGHTVYMDNFYTSIPLADHLLNRGTQITGTFRSNRKGTPEFLKKSKLKVGESTFARRKDLLIQRWLHKREIYVISTRHNGDFEEVKTRSGKVLKPKAIIEYNKYMGGVDKADQLTSYYTTPRKTMRWQLKVFFHLVDLCLWNALQLYNFEKPKESKLTFLQFRDAIITECIGDIRSTITPPVINQHFPQKMQSRLRCRYCSLKKKRSATFYKCDTCQDNGKPIALCTKLDCFKKFHDEKLYRNL